MGNQKVNELVGNDAARVKIDTHFTPNSGTFGLQPIKSIQYTSNIITSHPVKQIGKDAYSNTVMVKNPENQTAMGFCAKNFRRSYNLA